MEPWEATSQDTPESHTEEMAGASSMMLDSCGVRGLSSYEILHRSSKRKCQLSLTLTFRVSSDCLETDVSVIPGPLKETSGQIRLSFTTCHQPQLPSALFKILNFHFLLMRVLYAGVYVHCLPVWYQQKPEEGAGSPSIGIIDGCKGSCGCWELNLSPL